MNDWSDGYFTESTYTYGYFRNISPAWLNFCLLLNGYVAGESDENSAHCELGFGQGVSANIHAASVPGKYFGTDFNPAHAAHANELCKASDCGAKFFDDSFEEMLNRNDLPKFDSISLHGVWTWVSEENQKNIVAFARKFLKPGGVLYNSYNCYPGWSPGAPMRELFILYDKYTHQGGKTFDRIESALKFTEELFSKDVAYLQRVPYLKNYFEHTRKLDHDYLAHEYFNRDWICMYFSEVAEMMQSAKLDFACTTEPVEALPYLNFSRKTLEFLDKIENPIMLEQIKDYFRNRQFRTDIYVRGARKISDYERDKRLANMNYILISGGDLPKKVDLAGVEVTFPENVLEKIQAYLSSENYRRKNFADFIKKNPDVSMNTLLSVLVPLIQNGNIMPCQSDKAIESVKKTCADLNRYICNRAKNSDEIIVLASPVTGIGCNIGKFERIFLAAMFDGKNAAEEIAEYSWGVLSERGLKLRKGEKIIESAEENLAEFKKYTQNFLNKSLPVLKSLEII